MTWRPSRNPDDDRPRPLNTSLERLAHGLGAPRVAALSVVFTRWNDIVGEAVAAHARPLSLAGGVLRVGVDQPGWATELRFLGPEIVRECARLLGDDSVVRVEVRVEA